MYEDAQIAKCETLGGGRETVPERLQRNKKDLERSLADVNAAIEALERNPELTNTLNLLRRLGI